MAWGILSHFTWHKKPGHVTIWGCATCGQVTFQAR
jgi:hypothetical protein